MRCRLQAWLRSLGGRFPTIIGARRRPADA